MYVELHCASAFSFLQGASLPETLVERAAALGYSALALLDADGVYGAPRFHKAAQQAGLKAIIGAELTIETGGSRWSLPVLVETPEGYRHLCRLITRMKMRADHTGRSSRTAAQPGSPPRTPARWGGEPGSPPRTPARWGGEPGGKSDGALTLDELSGATAGLIAIGGRALLDTRHHGVGGLLDRLVGLFGRQNVCIELQRHLLRDEEAGNVALDALARAYRVPLIATNGVRFAEPADRALFDVLTCVRHHTTLDDAGRRLARNAERYLKSPEAMAQLFADRPDAVAGTAALAERLVYTMADLGYRFPKYPVPDGETEMSFLRHITEAGARDRYRPYHDKARAQISRELDLIEKLDLAGYFLIVWDIVNYARQHDILVQGRGSAANSAVCYSLGITAVDPIAMDLLFERFLSEERGEWPDIDLDFPSGDRREQVIQHVYEKYGRLGAAMTANVITYRSRSAAREVGKALSLNDEAIDRLAKVMNHFEFTDPNETLGRNLESVGLSLAMPRMRTFAELWTRIQDLPRHLGQHSGGMVICQGELDAVVPLEPATMPGRVVVQWDKDDCAEMGIVKVDLLGLGMMAVLQDAIQMVNTAGGTENTVGGREKGRGGSASPFPLPPAPFDLAHLPPDDPAVYDLLQKADTIGVFQVESRAQMATLPRLKPARFYDLVVEVAIIRPGPIVGDMVHPYLNRRAGREPVVPLHPSLEPVLARTLGVPLFQEQLLRMAMVAAGFTGGQAEELRRAMGFKRSEKRMKQIEVQLREGMAKNGITGDTAQRIITSITSFALYGFPESHAASFALLAYASAYLKVHYPAAFYTALLNNQPMGFYHPASLVKDAQRRGVRFQPIDVQRSEWLCRIEADGAIRLGLMYVNGLRKDVGQAIASCPSVVSHGNSSSATSGDNSSSVPGFSRTDRRTRTECPKCGSDDDSMIETVRDGTYFCNTCAHEWVVALSPAGRFASIEDLVRRTGVRRDELMTLADIGALNAFTHERRSALWQVERAVRPAGEMFREGDSGQGEGGREEGEGGREEGEVSPLPSMNDDERLQADYAGTGLTIGPHPMALRRDEMALRGVLRASDLARARDGRRVRVAGMVITRQRPGTAKGFVFLTLEDETGVANVIVRPDLFDRERLAVVRQPFLLVEGVLQHQDGVLSVRAERLQGINVGASIDAHDFY